MQPFTMPALIPAFPEMLLACMSLFLLMFGVAGQKEDYAAVARFGILTLAATAFAACRLWGDAPFTTFGDMFIVDSFGVFMKLLVIAGSVASLVMATRYAEREGIMRFEYPILVLFATLGMMLMISANDLMSMYMGLELQSLALYVLAALQRDSTRSTEAGLKYFILGALSSGMLLYGASLLYGYTGTTGFAPMAAALTGGDAPAGVVVGMVLVICGLAFKLAAVPFHMWAPDVYEGAPTSVTAFFAIAPKVAALALMTRVLAGPFGPLVAEWRQVVIFIAILSMALGAVAAIAQGNIKRMLAYSSIGHVGYALVGLTAADAEGVRAVIVYAALYMATSVGAFAIVLMMKHKDRMVERISDLAGLARTQPVVALAMAAMMFSMAGLPPLAGFFAKLFVFQAAVGAGLYGLAVAGVLSSVVAAYYYLRIVKVMYFDDPPDAALDPAEDRGLNFALSVSLVIVLFFTVMPGPLLASAGMAAKSLLP